MPVNIQGAHLIVDVKLGNNVRIIEPVNLYGCDLEDEVQVGPFTEIQSGAVIGKRTKIQSHSFVCSLVTVGADCFIGHGVIFTNDLMPEGPAGGDRSRWRETLVGDRVSIGSNATILPVSICNDVIVGAGSVVTKSITKRGVYAGNPAKFIRDRDLK